ncbi:MAG: hypothetical protein QOJ67_3531, partial [Acidimicrobiaceae bacterium]
MTEPLDRTNHEALLGAAPDAIIVVDTTGVIVLVNARAERLFGYGRDELIDQPIETLVPEVGRGVHRERRARDHADPRPRPMGAGRELAGRRKDGSEFPAEISLSAIETEDGVLVSAVIRDGTDRRQAAIICSSNDAIVSWTLDGMITGWNPGAVRMYGYEVTEVLGRNIEFLVPPEHRDEERAALARAAQGEQIPECEVVRLRSDGTPIDVAWTVSPIVDTSGIVIGVSSTAR